MLTSCSLPLLLLFLCTHSSPHPLCTRCCLTLYSVLLPQLLAVVAQERGHR